MNNNHQDNDNTRGRPFPHSFNITTTIQNVFRNINHAFAGNHDSSTGQQGNNDSRDRTDNNDPPLDHVNSVGGIHGHTRTTDTPHPSSPSQAPSDPPISSASRPTNVDMPPYPQADLQRDEDEDSMPELRSVTDSSDESDAGLVPLPSYQDIPVDDDHNSVWTDDEGDPPLAEPVTGTRRARVDDDGDDARDRRHPSERVGGPPPAGDAVSQNGDPQQPPRPPAGLFGALFGLGPPAGVIPHEHAHTGEDTADPSPLGNNPTPGHAPLGVPVLTAGFTLTIPFFGNPPGNGAAPAVGGQAGPPPGMFGMNPAAREELFASFAALFQEFQALDEAREDPERAKKLLAGLDVVPLGLVKRLERVGGAPGGHIGDSNAEGSSSGCAICWDTLLDAEGDSFSSLQSSGGEVPQSSASGTDTVDEQNEPRMESDAMNVDIPPVLGSNSEPGTSASIPPSSEAHMIISLPCAHVFHASCILPWFTRARQATCPTCRFNIDPENLTYTPPPRRVFNRGPPAQPDNAVPNPAAADPQGVPATGIYAADAARTAAGTHPETAAVPPGPVPPPPGGVPPGFSPFVGVPGIPILSFPAIQIPLRPNAVQAPGGGGNQGADVMTIGLDMFVGGPPHEERGDDPRDNAEDADGVDNGETDAGAAGGDGAANPNGFAQDLHSLIEGLLRTTRNIIPQVINAQGPAPAPAPDGAPAEGAQPQTGPAPEAVGPQPVPPPMGGPRVVPIFPFRPNILRPTRPMPPRRERKTWTLPPPPGTSLRQHVEQREREQGLRCSDTSCGIGPSDDDPYPEASASSTKQVSIHSLPDPDDHENDGRTSVCVHKFHPSCLVSAERVAGWGGEDKVEPLVEVSCPVCRSVGCVTKEEWELGAFAL